VYNDYTMKRFSFLFFIFFIFSFYFPLKASAQAASTLPIDQIITVEVVPEIPKSFQDVNISLESYSYNLFSSKISWYINGVLRSSAVGKKDFNFKTGDVGSVSKVKYQITTPEGVSFERTIPIATGDVTLLWESTGYTPPFYKGKSIFSFEGQARIIAVPNIVNANGTKYKPEELVYIWKRGMGTDTDASGRGRNIFYWNGSIVSNDDEIAVEVSNPTKTVQASASVIINPKEAEILAYENDPSLGILFNKAIQNNFNLSGSEVSFTAFPFYFNNPDKEGIYSWYVNGGKSLESSRNITFRNTKNEQGYSQISFDLSSQNRILQSASSNFDIYFGTKQTNSASSIFKSFFGN